MGYSDLISEPKGLIMHLSLNEFSSPKICIIQPLSMLMNAESDLKTVYWHIALVSFIVGSLVV